MANTYNFNAGPGALPAEVLQEAQDIVKYIKIYMKLEDILIY